ncbi:hypothetical protein HRbin37_02115 [bacterium HR37]|nr:hypothetical protein HRbin37_02115 [bacterium HR37]
MAEAKEVEKIETIFDHGVSEEELELLFMEKFSRQYYTDTHIKSNQELATIDIVKLYLLRGDRKTAEKYAKKLDPRTAFSLLVHD